LQLLACRIVTRPIASRPHNPVPAPPSRASSRVLTRPSARCVRAASDFLVNIAHSRYPADAANGIIPAPRR